MVLYIIFIQDPANIFGGWICGLLKFLLQYVKQEERKSIKIIPGKGSNQSAANSSIIASGSFKRASSGSKLDSDSEQLPLS